MERKTIWDACGDRLGEDVITTDRDGRTHIPRYDAGGRCVGHSDEKTDWRGGTCIDHTDASGHSLGHSTLEKDWWADDYIRTEQTRYDRERAEAARKETERKIDPTEPEDSGAEIIGTLLYGLGILLYRRWKKEINRKDFSRAVLRWALMGPVAYRKLGRAERLPPEASEPAAESQRRFCSECGSSAAVGERFCKLFGRETREEKLKFLNVLYAIQVVQQAPMISGKPTPPRPD